MEKVVMISVCELNKKFGDQHVLKNVSIQFEKGKIYGIVGRNGSGKTVLLKCMCGLLSPTSGEVSVSGKRLGKDVDFPSNIGFIIEAPGFLNHRSGYKNLKYLASIQKKIDSDTIRKYISMVGLDPDDKKRVGKYSLGMCQRLGIAQAVMENPDILILDEPMNGLDKDGAEKMRKLFLQLREEGKLIILATHFREDTELLCDEVYEMDGGILYKV